MQKLLLGKALVRLLLLARSMAEYEAYLARMKSLIECFSRFLKGQKSMARLDDLAGSAPVQPAITPASIPPSGTGPISPTDLPPNRPNAFTEVTIKQLYFFMWKWLAASILFALPFFILNLLIVMLAHK